MVWMPSNFSSGASLGHSIGASFSGPTGPSGDETISQSGLLKEGLCFLQKPFTPQGLLKLVRYFEKLGGDGHAV